MSLQTIMAYARRHSRLLGCIAGAVLLFCCIVPRRTESYFRTDLPRHGDQPVNNAPTDLPVPEGVESFVNCIGMRMIRVRAGEFSAAEAMQPSAVATAAAPQPHRAGLLEGKTLLKNRRHSWGQVK